VTYQTYHLHPLFAHFPLALLLSAAFFEWVLPWIVSRHTDRWRWVGLCLLCLGTVFAGLAVASGLWAEKTVIPIPSAYEVMEWHERGGITIGVVAAVLTLWRLLRPLPRPRSLYVLLWLLLVAALGFTGHQGGTLVFEYGVGVEAV
jgi:uncharacterized membrane protein